MQIHKSKKLLFIDYSSEGFRRYANSIVKEIKELNKEYIFFAVYMYGQQESNMEPFDDIVCANSFKCNPCKILDYFNPNGIVLFAHRFFDYMFTLEAHKRNIPVYNFQHGIYMSNTVISNLSKNTFIQLLIKKKEQIKLYINCIYYMNEQKIGKTIAMVSDLLKHQSLYSIVNKRFGKDSNADISFIYGEYWKEYYKTQYNETKTDFRIIGYPELEGKIKEARNMFKNGFPTVCYLAQTSVEDGIISPRILKVFLGALEQELDGINLILKLHPRSDVKLYNKIIGNHDHVVVWEYPEFPDVDFYIGHESTIVARALYRTNKTMIYRLQENRESPFEKYTDYVCTDSATFHGLFKVMITESKDAIMPDRLKEYIYKNPNCAIRETAHIIIESLQKN